MNMRVADYIADYVVEQGISEAFSVVGGGAMHLNDAFGHKQGLHVTYNHHEQACAVAAEGYARACGKMALVCVTTGPGGTNALTGVLGAWLDSIPMLVISGQVKYSTTTASTSVPLRQLGDQEYNICDSARPMTKHAAMVTRVEDAAYHVEKAVWLATHGRPGPCWVDIPLNIQAAPVEGVKFHHFDPSKEKCLPLQEMAHEPYSYEYTNFLDLLRGSSRPVIIAGGGIRTAGAAEAFERAVDMLEVPVCTAWGAHDLVADDHPLYAGRPGTVGTRGGNFVVQNADLVIALACRLNIRQISYNWENFAKDAKLVMIDIDQAELDKPTLRVDLPIHTDIREFLSGLCEHLQSYPGRLRSRRDRWIEWCRAMEAKYPACLPRYRQQESPLNPYVLVDELTRALPQDALTVCSNGTASVTGFQANHIKKGQRLFANSGSAAMGYGLPASIGAARARSGKCVFCFEGDGSLMMNLQELETLAYNKLDVRMVVFNNCGYHSIRQTQANSFDSNFAGVDPDSGVGMPQWQKIAAAFDIPYVLIDSLSNMRTGIDALLEGPGPLFCEAVVDTEQFFEPKLSSKRLPDGSMFSPSLEDMYPFLSEEEMASNSYGG